MNTILKGKIFFFLLAFSNLINAQQVNTETFKNLKFRSLGPAMNSGRIADIAIHPTNENIWYVAAGSSGVWKTENAGITWKPIFDNQTSYSIGCLSIDPNNSHTIWVGTGENVGGRHAGFGDGIYVSYNDGATWKNMGLKKSEHISKIIVHPKEPNMIWVAVQGPLWSKGGERGVYKSIDGGKNWIKKLSKNEWTGATDLAIDPNNPDVLYAALWQRHRTVAAYLGGGPGSGIYKSTDAGETWKELTEGIPKSNMGKIGLAISPFDSETIYAAIELERISGGLFMSTNGGISWKKQSSVISGGTGPHYYQELYASPHQEGRLYFMNNMVKISDDHGKTFYQMNEKNKHVDSHAVAFKKSDPNYILFGTDGGLYQTFDLTKHWHHISNLPITQFYKIAVDDASPFYHIYGGTQDNGSLGGPSRTNNKIGITNADWWVTLSADGHQSATEPGNPDITYAEIQQGKLWRVDQTTGETVFIQPQSREGDPEQRFNWDAPILVSPHKPTRLYFASQRVWKSENRGDDWKPISGDLTRDQERLSLPIMGQQQSWDNAWDVGAMSNYNTITSLSESPILEGLIYAGTDDGIIQVTENGGNNWRKIEMKEIKGVPATAFVNDIRADLFDGSTVYAALDNHKYGDYKPYLIKSIDKGHSWKIITGDLAAKLLTWRLVQDHIKKDLLFIATEFGIYFSNNSGKNWIQLKGGLPTISFRDLTIQRKENDLVAASFGRGIYILDDISPIRDFNQTMLHKELSIFPIKPAYWYVEKSAMYGQGDSQYIAKNPLYGAVITYFMPDKLMSLKESRKKKEKQFVKNKQEIVFPGWDALEKEKNQEKPEIILSIKNKDGVLVKTLKGTNKKGFNRVNWRLNYADKEGERLRVNKRGDNYFGWEITVTPGDYTVVVSKKVDGIITDLTQPIPFKVIPLSEGALKGASYAEIDQFREEYFSFKQKIKAANSVLSKKLLLVDAMNRALSKADKSDAQLSKDIYSAKKELLAIGKELRGYKTKNEIGERSKTPLPGEAGFIAWAALSSSTYGPTATHKNTLKLADKKLDVIVNQLQDLSANKLPKIEQKLKAIGAPWIEGQGI